MLLAAAYDVVCVQERERGGRGPEAGEAADRVRMGGCSRPDFIGMAAPAGAPLRGRQQQQAFRAMAPRRSDWWRTRSIIDWLLGVVRPYGMDVWYVCMYASDGTGLMKVGWELRSRCVALRACAVRGHASRLSSRLVAGWA